MATPNTSARDYSRLRRLSPSHGSIEDRMSALADALWDALSPQGVSWIGFYFAPGQRLDDGRTVGEREMLLGPCRDRPACSPIGLHGACGQCWQTQRPLVVRDVADLGANYVACDPRDRSEVVVPLFTPNGDCYAVLDADSFSVGAFEHTDAQELLRVLAATGLTHIPGAGAP